MKTIAIIIALSAAALWANPASACSSFGQTSGCFVVDPCGRQPGANAAPMCGNFCANSDGTLGAGVAGSCPAAEIQVSCGGCPNSNQTCGANMVNPFAAHEVDWTPNICVANCATYGATCGEVPGLVEPGGENWGASVACGNVVLGQPYNPANACPSGQVCQGLTCIAPTKPPSTVPAVPRPMLLAFGLALPLIGLLALKRKG